jgi:hypothetical protein
MFVDVRPLTVTDAEFPERGAAGTSRRQWLYLHPTSEVTVDVALPDVEENARVQFGASVALDPQTWNTEYGDGVRFMVLVTPLARAANLTSSPGVADATQAALDVVINPRAYASHRKWVPVQADLTRWAGQPVRLTLRTLPRDDASFDWAGWAYPTVYVRNTARDPEIVKVPHN